MPTVGGRPVRRVTFSTDVPFGRNSPTYFIAAIAGILSNISADVSFKTESFEELRGWNNAMIILDSADLTAATRSAVENVWSCRGRTFWTPNYIYIEESAFDQFVQLLEADAVNYVDALGIPIVNMNEREASSAEQKVIQPTDRQHFRFFVGLHPCRTEPAVGEGAILLPFRSLEEVFGSLPDCLSTSVWTEKMCGHVTSRLKVKTIWFNCHGIMEPETLPSFDSFPVGLSRLERMLLVRQEKYWTSFADEPLRLSVNLTELKSPALLALNERFFLLEPVRREMSKKLRFSVPLADSALRTTDSGLELMTYVVNRGPLVVNSPSIIPPDDLLTIVHYAVLNGSPVVVNSPSNISSESLIGLESKGYLLRVSHDLPVVLECPASYLVYFKEEESTEIPLVRWNQIGLSSRKVDCLHDCQHLLGYRMSVIYR
ncbi:Hypothetical protein NTJ_11717 [Nesidiocoris tenuis]|uniref:Aldehyde dehydrogenase domain-containing protein n=1 Tax=Nesidiocoris tenuis TaxID=355587 RepID=A0ABN7B3B3_9HEMI|nr:Hypothetical protein NTJ_11717 [Nesidiocoris tenuis]